MAINYMHWKVVVPSNILNTWEYRTTGKGSILLPCTCASSF